MHKSRKLGRESDPIQAILEDNNDLPKISIIGSPNVGKSTLFNRLIRKNIAIVDSTPGTTRDRQKRAVSLGNALVWLEDCGGFTRNKGDIETEINNRVIQSITEAAIIIYVLDFLRGISDSDKKLLDIIRKHENKSVIIAVNKVDNDNFINKNPRTKEFLNFGLGMTVFISALHNRGIQVLEDNLSDFINKRLQTSPSGELLTKTICIIGRPNVGKSSLVNALLGQNKMIVHSVPNTTRDSVEFNIKLESKILTIVDTAGIRKKKQIQGNIEDLAVTKSLLYIRKSDMVLYVVDALMGIEDQDKKIAGYIHQEGKKLIIVVNKWDLTDGLESTKKQYTSEIKRILFFADYAPIVFISALKKEGLENLKLMIDNIVAANEKTIEQKELNVILKEMSSKQGFSRKGKSFTLNSLTQIGVNPPRFLIKVSRPDLFHFSLRRQLENRIRDKFGFFGTALKIYLAKNHKN